MEQNFEGKTSQGVIYRITKRATVMVEDPEGRYADKEGKRYCKYYSPIGALSALPDENRLVRNQELTEECMK